MKERTNLLPCALEYAPRPGAHEIRVRLAPDGVMIRNARRTGHGQ